MYIWMTINDLIFSAKYEYAHKCNKCNIVNVINKEHSVSEVYVGYRNKKLL